MTSVPSATTWGSPTATKHALLIHGLTSFSYTWHRVASSLAAQGYSVTAPSLIGHGSRVSTDYRVRSIARDLCPYLEAKNYSLIIGHSLGALTALALSEHLPSSYPTAIILIDPPLQITPETASFYCDYFTDACTNPKSVEARSIESPLWDRQDWIFGEFGARLCSIDAVHAIFAQNKPWDFLGHLKMTASEKWRVTALIADPAVGVLCQIDDFLPCPHIRPVIVPGAGHCIQCDFPDVVVEEALKTVAGLDVA